MRTPQAGALLVTIFALAAAAPAGESWRLKPYTEWNEKEVRQVLEDSPWAHRLRLIVVKPGPLNTPCPSGNPHCSPDSAPTPPAAPGGRRRPPSPDEIQAQQDRRTASAMPPGLEGVSATAVVRWASARTIREAVARSGVQHGLVKVAEAGESSQFAPLDTYIFYVDLRVQVADVKRVPQGGVLTPAMVQNSVLLVKSTGERISPLSVKTAPLPEFDERNELALAAFYVFFPRQKDGKPVLSGDESMVRFECPLTPVAIHSEFDLHKMARKGSPDL
jgi:hypothetical protein